MSADTSCKPRTSQAGRKYSSREGIEQAKPSEHSHTGTRRKHTKHRYLRFCGGGYLSALEKGVQRKSRIYGFF
eukprot:1694212-Rhodomonas_salina.1